MTGGGVNARHVVSIHISVCLTSLTGVSPFPQPRSTIHACLRTCYSRGRAHGIVLTCTDGVCVCESGPVPRGPNRTRYPKTRTFTKNILLAHHTPYTQLTHTTTAGHPTYTRTTGTCHGIAHTGTDGVCVCEDGYYGPECSLGANRFTEVTNGSDASHAGGVWRRVASSLFHLSRV
jgi:hypothetical protein